MAQSETTTPQYLSSTKLSPEADSFVPGRSLGGGGDNGSTGKSISPQQFSQLPRYMTSCYPFVQGDPGATPGASGSSGLGSSGPGRPQAPNYTGQRMPAPHAGGYNFPGTRPPGPQNFTVRGVRSGGLMPRPAYPGGHVMGGYPGGHGPMAMGPPAGGGPPGGYPHHPYHHYPYGPHHPAMMGPPHTGGGWGAPPGGSYQPQPDYGHMPTGYGPGYHHMEAVEYTGSEWVRSPDRKSKIYATVRLPWGYRHLKALPLLKLVPFLKKKDSGNHMVSVGVQNESGALSGMLPKMRKPKTKTIILMDAAMQTDFSDEIANLTLAEKPNSLYRTRSRWADEYGPDHSCTTTDSEEVDSDSGYSSPLHRRNQMNNGTHPANGLYLPSVIHPGADPGLGGRSIGGGLLSTPGHHQHPHLHHHHLQAAPPHYSAYLGDMPSPGTVATTMAFSYSAIAAADMPTSAGGSPYLQSYPNYAVTVPQTLSATPTPTPTDSPLLTRTGSRSNVASSRGSRASSAGSPHPSSATKTEPEEDGDTEGGSIKKKKRRRNRRRKKKSGNSDDTGALSDEPSELRHAHSSSNVSRTSADAAGHGGDPGGDSASTGLRFEDEEEFPNLVSASSYDRKSSSHSNLSYSDILKTPASLSQENLLNSSQFHSSTSLPSDHEKSGGKESKNARKRRKRREMANRAADEELAEITLEQQVLRELSSKHNQPSAWPSLGAPAEPTPAPEPVLPVAAPPTPAAVELRPAVTRPKTPPATVSSGGGSSLSRIQAQQQPKPQGSGVKSKQPISLNIADMIDALEKQQEQARTKDHRLLPENKPTGHIVNILDSTAPAKRGKEREVPKPKKPSPLKKVILKEREEKKRMRLLDDEPPFSPGEEEAGAQMLSVPGMPIEGDLSQDGQLSTSSKSSSAEAGILTPMSAEMSPISQNSPISMSPLSPGGSPLSSGITSPIANNSMLGERKPQVVMKIHSRRFREYCTQILDKDIDQCCTELLQDLVRFQDRQYHKDPSKAKSKRRIVLGLREVTKHLRLRKIKVVIISPNLERIQSKGGLDEALNNIIQMCTEQEVPFVFALGRRALGRACAKLVPVSVVGIFNYEGSEENFRNLMDLTEHARTAYTEMVQQLEKEQQENPNRHAGSVPPFYAHMGHSRTPSACSAISFTSSILSEPISENYPQSEPETDSRGYEIIREALRRDSDVKRNLTVAGNVSGVSAPTEAVVTNTGQDSVEKVTIIELLDDIDEVRDEDVTHHEVRRTGTGKTCHIRRESDGDDGDDEEEDEEEENDSDDESGSASSKNDDETEYDRDTVRELPHIDSIHSSVVDLSSEILSQHSSKNPDLNTEVLSTHSSNKTRIESPNTVRTPASPATTSSSNCAGDQPSEKDAGLTNGEVVSGDATTSAAANPGTSNTHKLRSLDKERIESWVAETQQCIERFTVHDSLPAAKDGAASAAEELGGTTPNRRMPARTSPTKQGARENNVNTKSKHPHESNCVCDVHNQQQTS